VTEYMRDYLEKNLNRKKNDALTEDPRGQSDVTRAWIPSGLKI
jgi:hypothetical protein